MSGQMPPGVNSALQSLQNNLSQGASPAVSAGMHQILTFLGKPSAGIQLENLGMAGRLMPMSPFYHGQRTTGMFAKNAKPGFLGFGRSYGGPISPPSINPPQLQMPGAGMGGGSEMSMA